MVVYLLFKLLLMMLMLVSVLFFIFDCAGAGAADVGVVQRFLN